jgi:D-alanyl-D-alanine carboxypeptidase/D-alanyl-D-alanine-endopeptidase (penicillin-binding protein 4)
MARAAALPSWSLILAAALAGRPVAGSETLEAAIRNLFVAYRLPAANVAVAVIDARGEFRAALEADQSLKPASNQKLLTTVAALHWLGADYSHETTISSTAPLAGDEINGDLIVRGTGDPNISGRFYGGDPTALLAAWAQSLHKSGLRRVTGDLVADDTFLDDVRFPANWDRAQEGRWYAAQVSALSLNDNCLDLTIAPGPSPGSRARVSFVPACPLFEIKGAPVTVAKGRTRILVHRERDTNRITISGEISRRLPQWQENVTFDDPALVFASTFAEVLRRTGIEIVGRARRIDRPEGAAAPDEKKPQEAPAPDEKKQVLLIRHTSSLLQDLPVILKGSQNLHAELLLRVLGARFSGSGSLRGGEEAVRKYLQAKGIPDTGVVIADGSGLSHDNRVSARVLARVLHGVKAEPYFERYRDSLAVAGEDGTLKTRFRESRELRGTLFGKSGYISGVSCLSGYIVKDGASWCFSILVNGFPEGSRSVRELQEEICERIRAAMP